MPPHIHHHPNQIHYYPVYGGGYAAAPPHIHHVPRSGSLHYHPMQSVEPRPNG